MPPLLLCALLPIFASLLPVLTTFSVLLLDVRAPTWLTLLVLRVQLVLFLLQVALTLRVFSAPLGLRGQQGACVPCRVRVGALALSLLQCVPLHVLEPLSLELTLGFRYLYVPMDELSLLS